MVDPDGRAQRMIGAVWDIDERKKIEGELAAENIVLSRIVEARQAEIDELCHALSHDLRTPLRALHGFSRALQDEAGPFLDEGMHEHLERIQRASLTLGEIMDGLLSLARVNRVEFHPRLVDVTDLAQGIADEFTEAHPWRNVVFTVEPGMEAFGDPRLLRLAIMNLTSNAWKFTNHADRPRIEIGVTETGRGHALYVRDNGVGFDMRYLDKLFRPFQKLHSEREYPGLGVGLAIAARIVKRHGGDIWAESTTGATFFFTLPNPK
jgi:hypothetical protein